MLNTSSTYQNILANSHSFELRVRLYKSANSYITISESGIISGSITSSLFTDGAPTIGQARSSELDLVILEPAQHVPARAKVVVQYRARSTTTSSEWLTLGTFYVDTRSTGVLGTLRTLKLHCYDKMIQLDVDFPSTTHEWPATLSTVLSDIVEATGIVVSTETQTALSALSMRVSAPLGYHCCEVLQNIACLLGGNWRVTPTEVFVCEPLYKNVLEQLLITENGDIITFGANNTAIYV